MVFVPESQNPIEKKKKVYSVLASTKLLDQMICILSSINDSIISTNVISEVTSFFEEQVCFRKVIRLFPILSCF